MLWTMHWFRARYTPVAGRIDQRRFLPNVQAVHVTALLQKALAPRFASYMAWCSSMRRNLASMLHCYQNHPNIHDAETHCPMLYLQETHISHLNSQTEVATLFLNRPKKIHKRVYFSMPRECVQNEGHGCWPSQDWTCGMINLPKITTSIASPHP